MSRGQTNQDGEWSAKETPTDPEWVDVESGVQALRASPEFDGPDEPTDDHACNDHLALLYEDRAEQFAAVVPFVRQGLERGEHCLCIVEDEKKAETVKALEAGGIDVAAAVDADALSFHTPQETYLKSGSFDPEEAIEFFAGAVEDASEEGTALRVTGGTTWLLETEISFQEYMEYESKVNEIFEARDCIAMCRYDRTALPPSVIRDVVRTHPHLIYDGTVCHNFYYTPPSEFFGPIDASHEVDRMLGALTDRTEARAALQSREQFLREMYAVTSDPDRSFGEKVRRLLELGREWFGFQVGYFAFADPDTGQFEIAEAVGDHHVIESGVCGDLCGTYCQHVLESTEPVAVNDAVAEGWKDEQAYETFGLDSYLGTAITVDGERSGTLCFGAQEPREQPYDETAFTFLELMSQWVSYELERGHREQQLAGLNELSRELLHAETTSEIATATVDYAAEQLRLPITAVLTYDAETGQLSPAAQTPLAADELPTGTLCAGAESAAWEAFIADEIRAVEDINGLSEVLVLPIDQQGVFVTATRNPTGFSTVERDFVETTWTTVEAAFTRTDRERLLSEREAALESQNETLERLNRVNTTIRNIDQSLVQASTRTEIKSVVCEQLTDVGPYELAWIGCVGGATNEVVPSEWAGTEAGYLDEVTVRTDDSPEGQGPTGRAVKTREAQTVNDVLEDQSFAPWRQAALNRGYHAMIALPLVYDDTLYGVLNVYASKPGVFDDLERAVLAEMSDTIAYALNTVESRKALVGEEFTELEYTVEDADLGVAELVRRTGCTVTLENLVPQSDGGLRGYYSTKGATSSAILEQESILPVTELTLLSECTEGSEPVCLFEAVLEDGSLAETVLEHGGHLDEMEAADGAVTMTIEVAGDADVRAFTEMITTKHPSAELTAQRTSQRVQRTPREFQSAVTAALTDRQHEVLNTAYSSGYFEQPRTRNGSEIADSLGITQPTFNSHLRAAQRKLFTHLFETDALRE